MVYYKLLNNSDRDSATPVLLRYYYLRHEPETGDAGYWWPMENDFGQEAYQNHFDVFMRDYLSLRNGQTPTMSQIYETFKNRLNSVAIEDTVKDIHKTASRYTRLALGYEPSTILKPILANIALLVQVAWPFLLKVYEVYDTNIITESDFMEIAVLGQSDGILKDILLL